MVIPPSSNEDPVSLSRLYVSLVRAQTTRHHSLACWACSGDALHTGPGRMARSLGSVRGVVCRDCERARWGETGSGVHVQDVIPFDLSPTLLSCGVGGSERQ